MSCQVNHHWPVEAQGRLGSHFTSALSLLTTTPAAVTTEKGGLLMHMPAFRCVRPALSSAWVGVGVWWACTSTCADGVLAGGAVFTAWSRPRRLFKWSVVTSGMVIVRFWQAGGHLASWQSTVCL